jgi:hypothetical protein
MRLTLNLVLFGVAAALAAGATEVVSPDQVVPGSMGVCVTEMDGGEIVEIPLTVIGTVGPWTPEGEIVLVRLDDDRFRDTGIIAGMSGSPVIVDGRLLGALAYGWSFAKEPIGGVTPFVRMESLADPVSGSTVAAGAGRPAMTDVLEASRNGRLGEVLVDWLLPESGAGLQHLPVAVTSTASGIPTAGGWLAESWRRLGWQSVPGGAGPGGDPGPLTPGAMVAGVLVDGDAVVAAGGTVTEVRGDQVWAFGHPFLGAGYVRLPMARARVVTVLPSQMSSFKFFTVGDVVGSFTSDRSHGIWGRLGATVPMVPVRVGVDGRSFSFRSLRHPNLTPVLVAYLAQASQAARGRLFGDQTVTMDIAVDYAGSEPARYRESFSSAEAPTQASALAAGVVAYLETSMFEVPDLESITLDITTGERTSGAQLVDVVPARRVVRPGEALPVRLRFRPFRGDEFIRELKIVVPEGTPEGRIDLVAADGASWSLYDLGMRPRRSGSFADEVRLVNSLVSSSTVVLALERQEGGVALDGGTVTMPPGMVVQLQSGLGANLTTTSYAVSARVDEALGMALAGAVRIELQVRMDAHAEVP